MPLFWFLAGAMSAVAVLLVLLPWLRRVDRPASLPWQIGGGAMLILLAAVGLYRWIGRPELAGRPAAAAATQIAGAADPAAAGPSGRAGSMNDAIAGLEARLAKGGGSDADWDLLAKSYEFLGRPGEAARARSHQLPGSHADAGAQVPAASRSALSGEISLAEELRSKAAPGSTLFIVAKAADSPGPPVAVYRGRIGAWPLRFTLDDSQSMLPGRNLSSAGRVTVEARVSQSGQALPATGDLQGTSGVIDPSDRRPLKITIDRVIP